MKKELSIKMLRQRKLRLLLPVLVLPFVTLAFWALGGGKGTDAQAVQGNYPVGLNLELPGASFSEDKPVDKLGYYEKAAADSLQLQELMKNDPYFSMQYFNDTSPSPQDIFNKGSSYSRSLASQQPGTTFQDNNEAKVYQKIAELNTVLNDATENEMENKASQNRYTQSSQGLDQPVIDDRLIEMMHTLNTEGNIEDGELNQLNGMLDKILDIQHPGRIADKWKEKSTVHKGQVFAVSETPFKATVGLLDTAKPRQDKAPGEGFFGAINIATGDEFQNSIEAVVHESQVMVAGGVIKMRLLNNIYINGSHIPKGNFVFGTASLNNERLLIEIASIKLKQSIFPVRLEAYDLDGMQGIFIPGAITRDVAKEQTDNALQSVALNSLNPSIGAQAATAGIETAKTFLSKKVKLVKVQIKAGYRMLLKNTQSDL